MKVKNKEVTIKYLTFLLFFILNYFLFLFQKDYSIITKDLQTLFVTSEVIQKTWVPYLEVWDHKGPLYFWIYAFLDLLIFDKVMLINLYIIIFNFRFHIPIVYPKYYLVLNLFIQLFSFKNIIRTNSKNWSIEFSFMI
jgi:hypothetical protein